MLQKILVPNLSHQNISSLLKEAIEDAEINPQNTRNQINQNHTQLIPILLQHYELSLTLIFTSLSLDQCFDYLNSNNKHSNHILSVLDSVNQSNFIQKYLIQSKLFQKFTVLEKSLLIFDLFSQYSPEQIPEAQLPKFIPTFIRMAAYIIEQFLILKNEPAKGSEDRIQTDKVVVQNCQRWVSTTIQRFLRLLPKAKDPKIRYWVMLTIFDLGGALLQSLRQNNLDQSTVNNLLQKSVLRFFYNHYTLQQINKNFISELKKQKYNNPIKKLQIPETYDKYVIPNTQAYAYLVDNYLNEGLFSEQKQLKYLVPALCQSLYRPYAIKVKLMNKFVKSISSFEVFQIKTGFQWDYPIGLLLFYFFHYQKQQYQNILKRINFQSEEVLINSLINLKLMHFPNLSSQRDQFIMQFVNNRKITEVRILALLKNLKFEGVNYKSHNLLVETLKIFIRVHPIEVTKLIEERKRQTREYKYVNEQLKQIKIQ